jgi:hypothetical protein
MLPKAPYAATQMSAFFTKRMLELRPRKSQAQIADEAGFVNANILSMLKAGKSKLPLDQAPALAAALECDPSRLFRMAVAQSSYQTTSAVIDEIFGTIVSKNEEAWLNKLRKTSDNRDPAFTCRARAALRGISEK